MSSGNEYRRALVASQFHRARRRAALESLLSRLSGAPADLLSFDEVVGKLGISGQSSLGLQQVPIEAIIGSVGRYQDFSRTFLPRRESDENRWVTVGVAARTVTDLPAIEVYKVGDAYFVLDGNHRVSLARQQEIGFIDAHVTEVRTRAPLPPGARPDDLIVAAEYGAFLAFTQLDTLRPGADLRVSVPGQYSHLENHIEAYRFILETSEDHEIVYQEAVTRWYDDAYLPLVRAIREQGILRYFPGRTETDFFVWLARHRAELQNELGYTITPDVTVSRLLSKVRETQYKPRPTIADRLRQLSRLTTAAPAGPPRRSWAEERTLDRYSTQLFANVLFPIVIDEANGHAGPSPGALGRALQLAKDEGAHFCALCVLSQPDRTASETAALEAVQRVLDEHAASDELLIEIGDPTRWTIEMAYLNDLIVLEPDFSARPPGEARPTAAARAIIEAVQRPILVVGESAGSAALRRVLLVHDTRREFDEAIFIAAYLAERWGIELSVLPLSNGRNTEEMVGRVGDYFALHEVSPTFLEPARPDEKAIGQIIGVAQAGDLDLVILAGPDRQHKNNRNHHTMDIIQAILREWNRSILIAT